MRKILFAVIVAAAFVGCSKDDSDSTQTTPKAVCHFDDFRRANGNPQITYGTTADGKRCRQIDYDCLCDTIQSHGPAHLGGGTILLKLLTNFKESEIVELYSESQTPPPNLTPTNWTLIFDTGDRMFFDIYDERNFTDGIKIINTKFQCVHIN